MFSIENGLRAKGKELTDHDAVEKYLREYRQACRA
jgi:hypothetical protein